MKKEQNLNNAETQALNIPVVNGSYYWVKLMTDDKYEPAIAINILGEMNFKFFNGVAVPCNRVTDYSECNYRKNTKMKEEDKDLNYWKENAKDAYMTTPICVLRYITELELNSKRQ